MERAVLPGTLAGAGERVIEQNFARAAALFASARALNAGISVLQSTEVTGSVVVAQGTISPGQALDPINQLIERFSDVMLSATVALGAALIVVKAGDVYGLSSLLPLGLLLAGLALWLPGAVGNGCRRGGQVLLVAALIAKIGLPVAVLATDAVADRLVSPVIEDAGARLEAIDVPRLPPDAVPAERQSWADRLGAVGDLGGQISKAAAAAAGLADTVIDLTVAYVVKLLVLPVVILWLLGQVAGLLVGGLMPKRAE